MGADPDWHRYEAFCYMTRLIGPDWDDYRFAAEQKWAREHGAFDRRPRKEMV